MHIDLRTLSKSPMGRGAVVVTYRDDSVMSQAGEIYVMLLKSFARAHVRYEDRERAAIQPWAFPALGRVNHLQCGKTVPKQFSKLLF